MNSGITEAVKLDKILAFEVFGIPKFSCSKSRENGNWTLRVITNAISRFEFSPILSNFLVMLHLYQLHLYVKEASSPNF